MDDPTFHSSLVKMAAALRSCADAIECLALSLRETDNSRRLTVHDGDRWPDVMTTGMAARYCGYKSTSALRKAHLTGRLFPVGRRGGNGTCTWARADLDEYLRGGKPMSSSPTPRAETPESPTPPPARTRRRARRAAESPEIQRALESVRDVTKKYS